MKYVHLIWGLIIGGLIIWSVIHWQDRLIEKNTPSGIITTSNPKDIRTFESKCDGNITYEKLDHISPGAYRVTCWPNNPITTE